MSFRFTNNLVGVFQHRLQLEAAHRAIARRTFTGVCHGVEVTCSGFGTVLAMKLIDKPTWEPYYRRTRTPEASSTAAAADTTATAGIDLERLATSIRAATWAAVQKIHAVKEQAHHSALATNSQLASEGQLQHWYAHDANAIAPHFDDGLTSELGTPWMQAVRYGVNPPAAAARTPSPATPRRGPITALRAQDCTPSAIPIGSVYPLLTPALLQLESAAAQDGDGSPSNTNSRIDHAAVVREQKKEMAHDERRFWDRVELIRRSQLATIPGGVKRSYADPASTVQSDVTDKVELRFTR